MCNIANVLVTVRRTHRQNYNDSYANMLKTDRNVELISVSHINVVIRSRCKCDQYINCHTLYIYRHINDVAKLQFASITHPLTNNLILNLNLK